MDITYNIGDQFFQDYVRCWTVLGENELCGEARGPWEEVEIITFDELFARGQTVKHIAYEGGNVPTVRVRPTDLFDSGHVYAVGSFVYPAVINGHLRPFFRGKARKVARISGVCVVLEGEAGTFAATMSLLGEVIPGREAFSAASNQTHVQPGMYVYDQTHNRHMVKMVAAVCKCKYRHCVLQDPQTGLFRGTYASLLVVANWIVPAYGLVVGDSAIVASKMRHEVVEDRVRILLPECF